MSKPIEKCVAMRILFALTYYRPHVSGLTIYVQRLAEALAARGHQVSVLTSQYARSLPREQTVGGVRVIRAPVALKINKGAIMPSYVRVALPLLRGCDVAVLNLPNTPIEATLLPMLVRFLARRPIVATYHCDVQLPAGFFNRLINQVVFLSNAAAGALVQRLVAYTSDYAGHSPLLRLFRHKQEVIPPPVVVSEVDPDAVNRFRRRHGPDGEHLIGFAARLAPEKGVEFLLAALPRIRKDIPNVKVLFVGEFQNVFGEKNYRQRLQPLLAEAGDQWRFLGVLDPTQMAIFYGACDLTVLPSINRTESFGLVQVESMLCGTPVVATSLPGVRVPVLTTGMGRIVPPGDAAALSEAVVDVIRRRKDYVRPRVQVEGHFSLEKTVRAYEQLFERLTRWNRVRVKPLLHESTASTRGRTRTVAKVAGRGYLREHLREVPPFRALLRSMECRLFEQAGPVEEPVLDLGCGDGHFASMVFRESPSAGIDEDQRILHEARARSVHQHLMVASATELPFPSNFFKAVVANCVLEHIPDIDTALAEVFRVSHPVGRLLFSVPSHRFGEMLLGSTVLRSLGFARCAQAYADWFNRRSSHFHTDHPATWLKRLARHGFKVLHWEYYMSPTAHQVFDLAHYLSAPRLISRKLSGKWVLFSNLPTNILFERWLRPHYEAKPTGEGAYLFFHTRKSELKYNEETNPG